MPIQWYFDFISPFAYLQWPRIRELARSHPIAFRPILFAGVLDHIGQKGPAEIPAKREFTYRYVLWKARQRGVPLTLPPAHPFNPLPALRLCVAAGTTAAAIDAIFAWIWADGRAADSVEALTPLAARLGIDDVAAALAAPGVKAQLRANFDAALAAGVFGVPTVVIDGELFWGEDATDFAEAFLADRALFEDAQMRRIGSLPIGASRTG